MTASKADVDRWITEAIEQGATHVISVCDTFDYDDYPVFVMSYKELDEKIQYYRSADMQSINEVINIEELLKKESEQREDPVPSEPEIPNLSGYEAHDYESFKKHHVCPDRKMHDNVPFEVTFSRSFASAIGCNAYVKCERCGTMHDITNYSEW